MVRIESVSGYEEFRQFVTNSKEQVNIYFTGKKEDITGKSWCPDCNEAEPHVMKNLEEYAKKQSVFLIVDVGDRSFWKDLKNSFRQDANVKLSVIPTLIRWQSERRLEGEQCAKPSLLEMFFVEDLD